MTQDKDGIWQKTSLVLANLGETSRFISYTNNMLITDKVTRAEAERAHWIPESFWKMTEKLFRLKGTWHQLQYWNLRSGHLEYEFRFFESADQRGYFLDELVDRQFISEDGKWLAVELEGKWTVYDTTGRRTVWCWVVVVGLVLLAVWICWPRWIGLRQS